MSDEGLLRLPTAEEAEAFWRDGVVCLRGVLDPAYVLAMAPRSARGLASSASRAADSVRSWRGH